MGLVCYARNNLFPCTTLMYSCRTNRQLFVRSGVYLFRHHYSQHSYSQFYHRIRHIIMLSPLTRYFGGEISSFFRRVFHSSLKIMLSFLSAPFHRELRERQSRIFCFLLCSYLYLLLVNVIFPSPCMMC